VSCPPRPVGLPRRVVNTAAIAALARWERRVPYASPESIERRQRRRLRAMVRHGYETTRFWRAALDARGLRPEDVRDADDLARLPLLDGRLVRTRLDEFRSSGVPDGETVPLRSSGSTDEGVRKVVPWDRRAQLQKLPRSARDRAAIDVLAGEGWARKEAYLLPSASESRRLRRFWDEHLLLGVVRRERSWIPVDRSFEEIASRLRDACPSVVYSYGSFAEHFLGWAIDRGVELDRPRVWIYGGDTFSCEARRAVERALGFPVASTYQTVEAGRIGFECERREGYHVHTDVCVVRIVDEQGCDVPRGEPGEVVVSSLVNRATVLLNARLGDRAAWVAGPCPCGRTLPRLAGLEGRISEIVRAADGREWPAIVLKNRFKDVLDFALQVQIVHPTPGEIVWRVAPLSGVDAGAGAEALVRESRAFFGSGTRVEARLVERIPRTPAGKVPAVVTGRDGRSSGSGRRA